MKKIKKGILGFSLLFVLTLIGCSNGQPCYHCYVLVGEFKAIRGTDTIPFEAATSIGISDSTLRYINMNYHIDTGQVYYEEPNISEFCGNSNYQSEIAMGDTCSEIL